MKYSVVMSILVSAAVMVSRNVKAQESFDAPDSNLETKIYDINQKFNTEPVPDSEWLNMLGSHRSESYRIQTGDNLWDISQTFFGDGKYWPKLWSENSHIENPHQILPHKKILFVAGTSTEAPTFNVVEDKEVLPSAPTYVAPDVQDDTLIDPEEPRVIGGKPKIPKPATASAPVLSKLPPSFKSPIPPVYGQYDSTGLDVHDLVGRNVSQKNQLIPFIAVQELPASLGRITEMESGFVFAGNQQVVLVQLDQKASVGQQFTTFHSMGKLSNDEISKGYILEVGGKIEIKGLVEGETDVYRAAVIEAVNPVRKNSIITTIPLPNVNFAANGSVSSTVAKVVGGEYDKVRRVVGIGSVVFLEAESKPLSVGEILTVDAIRKTRNESTEYPSARRPVAIVKVANVDSDLATAIIINSFDEVSVGDITGGPAPKPDFPSPVRSANVIEIKNSK